MSDRMLRLPGPWTARAACRGQGPTLWFPEHGDSAGAARAAAICARCPVRQDCADYAAAANEHWGIWAGMGREARKRQRRGSAA